MAASGSRSPVILLAEDSPDEVLLLRRAMRKARLRCPLHVVENGEQAVAYLKGEGRYSNRDEFPLPTLMLLDLKMPKMDGFQVLQWIHNQGELETLRVVVLTASDQVSDINMAYRLGASSFLTKPVQFEEFVALLDAIQDFWIDRNQNPHVSRPPKKKNGQEH